MKIALHDRLRKTVVEEATSVVIYDKFDNPIAIAIEPSDGLIIAATAEHPEFNQLLAQMKINRPVVVQTARLLSLPTR